MNASAFPPDLGGFNFTNCTAAAHLTSVVAREQQTPLNPLVDVIRDGIHSHLHENNLSTPNINEMMLWIGERITANDKTFLNKAHDFTLKECKPELCPLLGWQGDPDLTGRGMLVNFIAQAVLATIYSFVLFLLWRNPAREQKRLLNAIKHSTRIFLDASVLFSLAMLTAATYTFTYWLTHPGTLLTFYSAGFSIYLSLYSTLPVVVLYAASVGSLRRTHWRRLVWLIIIALGSVISWVWVSKIYFPQDYWLEDQDSTHQDLDDPDHQQLWDNWCLDRGNFDLMSVFTIALVSLLSLGAIIWGIFIITRWCRKQIKSHIPLSRLHCFAGITVCVAVLVMWLYLSMFIYFRNQMRKGGGETSKDAQWSFGQILGLVTWVPVVVECFCILKKGPEEALTNQLMEPLCVVHEENVVVQEKEDGAEDGSITSKKGKYVKIQQRDLGPA